MTRLGHASGFTLIEAMIAMVVLLVGSLGMLSLHVQGLAMNADARVMTRATAIAQDLADQMQAWDWTVESASGGRLYNTTTSNDADFADTSGTLFDHTEDELETTGGGWLGIPSATVKGLGFTRHWNVAEVDRDALDVVTGKRVAVVVEWQRQGGVRRIVLVTFLRSPQVTE